MVLASSSLAVFACNTKAGRTRLRSWDISLFIRTMNRSDLSYMGRNNYH